LLTGGTFKWGRVREKERKRNGLILHTERQVTVFSCDDYRGREGGKAELKRKWKRENAKLFSWNVQKKI
jgi:hypothetical protein